jgi:hypothetical protein
MHRPKANRRNMTTKGLNKGRNQVKDGNQGITGLTRPDMVLGPNTLYIPSPNKQQRSSPGLGVEGEINDKDPFSMA